MAVRNEFEECETEMRLDGKVIIVTGATSGTGLEVAKNLASRGAKVIIGSRDPYKLAAARRDIHLATGNEAVVARRIDLASLSSVRSFVNETIISERRLDALINNAGAVGLADELTEDGLQLTMQVNYFGAFLLTYLLYPLLKSSAPSRVVNVSSLALLLGDVDFERMNRVGDYSAFGFYCNAKLAQVLSTVEMARRIGGSGVNVNSMDPGLGKSDFFRHFEKNLLIKSLSAGLIKYGRSLENVAKMPVFLAIHPRLWNVSGEHYRDCEPFYGTWLGEDALLTARLWDQTKRLVKITKEEDWELNECYD